MLWDTEERKSTSFTLQKRKWQRAAQGMYQLVEAHFFPQQIHISLPLKQESDFWSNKEFLITFSLKVVYSYYDELFAYEELFTE